MRIICFPHIAGGAAIYNSWIDRLPSEVELCAVRLPARENRIEEPPIDEMSVLLDQLENVLAPLLDRPFVLFGHCAGSNIAFNLARRLRKSGLPNPALLIVSSIEAPAVRVIHEPMHALPSPELFERVARFGGIAHEVLGDPELLAMFEPIIRADYRLIEREIYKSEPPLKVPVTVIGGIYDKFVDYASMTAWRAETTETFSMHLLKSGHFVLQEAVGPVCRLLADLQETLL